MNWARRLLFAALAGLVGLVVGAVSEVPSNYPLGALDVRLPPLFAVSVQGLWTVLDFAAQYPLYVLVLVAVVALPMLVATLVSLVPRRIHKDPQRLYTVAQRAVAANQAGGRCEMESILYTRCKRPGEAGDHWYPHSKGGATSLPNQVWACTRCNSSKGAKVPTFWQTARLEMRRRRYFPPGAVLRPGDKVKV